MDWYFFLLAGLMSIALAIFMWLSKGYVYADATILDALVAATSDSKDNLSASNSVSETTSTSALLPSDAGVTLVEDPAESVHTRLLSSDKRNGSRNAWNSSDGVPSYAPLLHTDKE